MDTEGVRDDLTFSERLELVKAFSELRNQPPIGAIGLLEFRDFLGSLFPEFADVRNTEIDELIDRYSQSLNPIPELRDNDPAR